MPTPRARYDFATLQRVSGLGARALAQRLWDRVWRGLVSNDGFAALRRGIDSDFTVPEVGAAADTRRPGRRFGARTGFARWKAAVPFGGNWYRLPDGGDDDADPLVAEERGKDRVRLLLDRYGILFRQLLARERPALRWSVLFRSLRLMELSGEILAGCFFDDVPGPQFISHAALRTLSGGLSEDAVYWLGAADPASLCGVGLDGLRDVLPRRVAGAHLVYRGPTLVLVSQRLGRHLRFHVAPDDPDLPRCLGPLDHLLTRRVRPLRRVTIETINGEHAAASRYVEAMRGLFEVVVDYHRVLLTRRRR